ncbi:MAG TPA: penicillin-binding protein 2 [Candidatus Saccharimonadales bacterium]|nr:penicillin-binding protein 2 [Candidatus Saccharimonadales bacterium]
MTRSTTMIRPTHLRRLFLFAVLAGLGIVGLGVRLYFLQIVRHDKYRDIVGDNTQRVFLKSPRRGDILDANGHQLASSLPVKRVLANPSLIHPHQAVVAHALAPILGLEESNLVAALRLFRTNELGVARTNKFVDLKCRVTHEQWGQITQAMTGLKLDFDEALLTKKEKAALQGLRRRGVYAEDDYLRVYPSGRLASHVLGYVLEVERVFTNATTRAATIDVTGVYGLEHWLDGKLRGTRGWRVTEQDRQQRELVVYREQDVEPQAGLSARLSLDMFIQNILEAQLAEAARRYSPKSVCGLVVRPRTGEILGMASLPDFDPNTPAKFSDDARRNRVISDPHEPGSTFKIVVVSGALDADLISLNDVIFCENGRWQFKGRPLHDHDRGYGNLTVEGIITHSSNIGAAKIAVYHLGEERLYDYITRFGFGERTGITLDGERAGTVHPLKQWDGLTVSRIPMGHAMTATHLQMMMAMCAIANEGRLMRPMLIQSLQDSRGEVVARFQPQFLRQVVHPRAARQLVQALKTVTAKDGTAPKAGLESYTVAGKTGTAQVPGPNGYLPQKYVSSFIGFFPADDPEVCISVILEEPDMKKGYYGGTTAAPYFRVIAEQVANYLKIKPDNTDAFAGTTNTVPSDGVAVQRP